MQLILEQVVSTRILNASPVVHVIDAQCRAITRERPSYYGRAVQTWVAKCKLPSLLTRRVIGGRAQVREGVGTQWGIRSTAWNNIFQRSAK